MTSTTPIPGKSRSRIRLLYRRIRFRRNTTVAHDLRVVKVRPAESGER